MQYPLEMRFKIFTLAQQISVYDASGAPIMNVKQKMFRLKEQVEVFTDSSLQNKLFDIS